MDDTIITRDAGATLSGPAITKEALQEATLRLTRYKAGKASFERRCIENEQWWKLRHWEHIKEKGTTRLQTKSAWLINVILSKHADAMDAYPEPSFLPRESADVPEAEQLSSIVPVLLEQDNFEKTWSDNWWKKLKAGVAFYGVFWDPDKLGGLGDVSIRAIDPLQLFWEPGITDLQKSREIFYVQLANNDELRSRYPQLEGKLKNGTASASVNRYIYDDHVDTSDKSAVVDWYYKRRVGGRTVLHYVKFVGDTVLYATEDDTTGLAERGLYDHGMYPFFADPLFPEEGTPTGYGYIDICKDAQRQIDLMNNAIVANCVAAATPRWLKRGDDGINEEEYADWTRPFVHVQGSLEDSAIRPIPVTTLTGNYLSILESKIAELKETTGNRDVNNGGAPSGVTAASAIAAMQEQSGKLSRDQIQASYRCFREVVYCVIELIRQFYEAPRTFRITGKIYPQMQGQMPGQQPAPGQQPVPGPQPGGMEFVTFDNQGLQPQPQGGTEYGTDMGMRLPVFDIDVESSKQSSYSKLSYNELAIQFFQLGFFNPQLADQALAAMEMMDFKGREQVRQRIAANNWTWQQMQMMQAQMAQMAAMLGMNQGPVGSDEAAAPAGGRQAPKLQQTDALGGQQQRNTIVERARDNANQATQPR